MWKRVDKFEEISISVLFVAALLIVTARGVIKYISPETAEAADEISQYLYCYMAFLSLGYCIKFGSDLSIKLFPKFIEKHRFFHMFYTIIYALCYGIMLIASVKAFLSMGGQVTAVTHIPQRLVYFSTVFGFILGLVRLIGNLLKKKETEERGKQ